MEHFMAKLQHMKDTVLEMEQRGCSEIKVECDHTDLFLKEKKIRVWYSSGLIEELPIV